MHAIYGSAKHSVDESATHKSLMRLGASIDASLFARFAYAKWYHLIVLVCSYYHFRWKYSIWPIHVTDMLFWRNLCWWPYTDVFNSHTAYVVFVNNCVFVFMTYTTNYSRTLMVLTSLGPWKFDLDMGSTHQWGFLTAPGQAANGD